MINHYHGDLHQGDNSPAAEDRYVLVEVDNNPDPGPDGPAGHSNPLRTD